MTIQLEEGIVYMLVYYILSLPSTHQSCAGFPLLSAVLFLIKNTCSNSSNQLRNMLSLSHGAEYCDGSGAPLDRNTNDPSLDSSLSLHLKIVMVLVVVAQTPCHSAPVELCLCPCL